MRLTLVTVRLLQLRSVIHLLRFSNGVTAAPGAPPHARAHRRLQNQNLPHRCNYDCNHKVISGNVDDLRRHAANCSQATPEALSRLNRLIRCRCLTWTLVPLNLVHGVWMSCCDLKTCHVNNRFPGNQH